MKIYLDFDDTILDTDGFIRELVRIFQSAGFSQQDFYDNYELTKQRVGDFDLDTIFDIFASQRDFDVRSARRSADRIFDNVDVFVHDDFFDLVKEFPKEQLAMLSFGTTPFQRAKIENSKIVPYFGEIIVTDRSKEENFKDIAREHATEQLYFVEDKADQIDRVKLATPEVVTMKIERPHGRYVGSSSARADHVVKDFYDVMNIIKGKL